MKKALKALYVAFALVLALGLVIPLAGCGAVGEPDLRILGEGTVTGGDEPAPPAQATISTDKADYEPGDTVAFTGGGFEAGETVNIEAVGETNGTVLAATATADDSGAISGSLELPMVYEATFSLTATGASSGLAITTSFLDKVDMAIFSPSPSPNDQAIGSTVTYTAITVPAGVNKGPVHWSGIGGDVSNEVKYTNSEGKASADFTVWNPTASLEAKIGGGDAAHWDINGTGPIHVKPSTLGMQGDCQFGVASWHFVINQIANDSLAPASITVYWDGGASADVRLDTRPGGNPTGGTAHYTTTANAGHIVTDATANIYDAWPGEFNLSHAECEEEPPVTPQATITTDLYKADGTGFPPYGQVPLGTIVYDTATVTGNVPGTPPTGTVTFKLYKGTDNTGELIYSDTQSVGTQSANSPALHAGSYVFQATYNGDGLYGSITGDYEPFVVDMGTVTLATTIYNAKDDSVIPLDSHVALGTSAYDKVTVTGNTIFFNFADVTYEFNDAGAGSGVKSATKGPLHAGNYHFQAFFAGNDDYNAAESDPEPFVVDKGTVRIDTTPLLPAESPIPLASIVKDRATVTGSYPSFVPTGTVDFKLYKGVPPGGDLIDSQTGVPLVNGVAATPNYSPQLHAGDYYYLAGNYGGDDDYEPYPGNSAPEPFKVRKADVTIVTVIYTKSGEVVTGQYPIASTTIIYDKATVTGIGMAGFPLVGYVDFTYDSTSAGSFFIGGDPVTVQSNDVGPLPAGGYAFKATYRDFSGDYNNKTSDLEPFTVLKVEKGKNGKTLGFWSNKNGQTYVGPADLAMLVGLNLVDARAADFNPTSYTAFRTWLLRADAVYMGYMLSAQLSATELTVYNGLQDGTQEVWLDDGDGIIEPEETPTINEIMIAANGLTKSTNRALQEYYKNLLDKFNNNLLWLIFP